jgi:hypothetical protein
MIWALFMFAGFLTRVHGHDASGRIGEVAGPSASGARVQTPEPAPAP